jgi:hypothetical protein
MARSRSSIWPGSVIARSGRLPLACRPTRASGCAVARSNAAAGPLCLRLRLDDVAWSWSTNEGTPASRRSLAIRRVRPGRERRARQIQCPFSGADRVVCQSTLPIKQKSESTIARHRRQFATPRGSEALLSAFRIDRSQRRPPAADAPPPGFRHCARACSMRTSKTTNRDCSPMPRRKGTSVAGLLLHDF